MDTPPLKRSHLACMLALGLGLAFSTEAWTGAQDTVPRSPAERRVQVSLVVEGASCDVGRVEAFLADWLDASAEAEFASPYAALAFDELVVLVGRLRDLAEDMCW